MKKHTLNYFLATEYLLSMSQDVYIMPAKNKNSLSFNLKYLAKSKNIEVKPCHIYACLYLTANTQYSGDTYGLT